MGVNEVLNFVVEKQKEALLAVGNLGGIIKSPHTNTNKHTHGGSEMGVNEVQNFVVEKLKEAPLAVGNLGGEALAWFDNVFPPETRGGKINHWFHVALPFLIAAVVLTVVFFFCRCVCKCCCGGGGRRVRMMKAPGRNCRMPRSMFANDPKGYFVNLRAHPGDALC